MRVIRKAGLLFIREKRMLLCRKRHGMQLLILPGGKYEAGETAIECLAREVREELGEQLELVNPEFIGTYTDIAAGAPNKKVRSDLYMAGLSGEPQPCSEIGELIWFGRLDDLELLSPSLRNKILPDLSARGFL